MEKNKLLVVYNTCGISGRDNTAAYANSIQKILEQKFENGKIVISSCLNSPALMQPLMKATRGKGIDYNLIKEKLPVNVTFNHSVKKCREIYGDFEGYLYIDSGCSFTKAGDLQKLYDMFKSGPYAMASTRTTTDTGIGNWFGKEDEEVFQDGDLVVPVGKAINLHTQIFSHDLIEAYGHAIPDIFASYCTESTFSFLCAAIKKNWVMSKDVIVDHLWGMDGASSGFNPNGIIAHVMDPWKHLFRSPKPMEEIIKDPVGIKAGFGYEEVCDVLMHDESQFDSDGFCLNEDLEPFIKNNLFLKNDMLDYNTIDHTYVSDNYSTAP